MTLAEKYLLQMKFLKQFVKKKKTRNKKTNVELFATQTPRRKSNGSKTVKQEMEKNTHENIDILEDD